MNKFSYQNRTRRFRAERRLYRRSMVFGLGRLVDVTGKKARADLKTPYRPVSDDILDVADEWRSVRDSFGDTFRSESRELLRR